MVDQPSRGRTSKSGNYLFDDIGWSIAAFVAVVVAWYLMNYQFGIKDRAWSQALIGIILVISLGSVVMGAWKARFWWKFIAIGIALLWITVLPFYLILLAGPLDTSMLHIPW